MTTKTYQSKRSVFGRARENIKHGISDARSGKAKERILVRMEAYASHAEKTRIAKANAARIQSERIAKIRHQLFGDKKPMRRTKSGHISLLGLTK